MDKILIVDDEKNVLSSFKKILSQDGYNVVTANSAEEGLSLAETAPFDLLVMDIKMPGLSGLQAFSKFKEIDAKIPIIIMTAYGTTDTAIEAMRLGAYDYVVKPFEVSQIKSVVKKALEAGHIMKTEVAYDGTKEFKGDSIIGSSFKMQQIYKAVGQIAGTDTTVLIRGDSGTGKELIARAIYQYSKRKNKPLLVINSAAIPETLLESEFFGYEKGAFTDAKERRIGKLEQGNEGTIFLDEIGDMPLSIQTKILRVLEHKAFERLSGDRTIKVDVRLICATNKNLEALIKEGRFRDDLYYRLNAVTINLPSLCERKEDIPELIEYFIRKYNKELKKDVRGISKEAQQILAAYDWPGNVRELENIIKKAMLFSKGNVLISEDVQIKETSFANGKNAIVQMKELLVKIVKQGIADKQSSFYKDTIEEVEKVLIIETLKQTQGNQSQAARILGISRPTLKDYIEQFGLRKIIDLQETQKD